MELFALLVNVVKLICFLLVLLIDLLQVEVHVLHCFEALAERLNFELETALLLVVKLLIMPVSLFKASELLLNDRYLLSVLDLDCHVVL